MTQVLHHGHVLEILPTLPAGSVRTCVTSPPYWGLRDYGLPPSEWPCIVYAPMPGLQRVVVEEWSGCLGLEPDPFAFVGHLVQVFREVWRALAEDGTLWLNLGDCWAGARGGAQGVTGAMANREASRLDVRHCNETRLPAGLKPKDLLGIPWRVALALQADGWFLRSENIWHKPNPMPESVRDRPTKAHEQVFLLSKSERYFYDADAIAEPRTSDEDARGFRGGAYVNNATFNNSEGGKRAAVGNKRVSTTTRNKRSVWTIPTQPFGGAHFATMPPKLARTCIRAGSAPGDVVLDPFSGAGTTGLVASREGRRFVGVELSEDYCRLARERWREDAPLLMGASP